MKEVKEKIDARIEKLALRLSELSELIEMNESHLKKLNEEFNEIKLKTLPELMEAEGFAIGSKINLANGRIVSLKEFFSASIPSNTTINKEKDPFKADELRQKREDCLRWLDDNGLGGVIKSQIVALFDRGEIEIAKQAQELLMQKGIASMREESVHPQTLNSALKEVMKKGINVPFEQFSVNTGAIVDIK